MLNKEICKKCHCARANDGYGSFMSWGAWDDDQWKVGVVFCVAGSGHANIDVTGTPPDSCMYFFEQAIAEGVENVE